MSTCNLFTIVSLYLVAAPGAPRLYCHHKCPISLTTTNLCCQVGDQVGLPHQIFELLKTHMKGFCLSDSETYAMPAWITFRLAIHIIYNMLRSSIDSGFESLRPGMSRGRVRVLILAITRVKLSNKHILSDESVDRDHDSQTDLFRLGQASARDYTLPHQIALILGDTMSIAFKPLSVKREISACTSARRTPRRQLAVHATGQLSAPGCNRRSLWAIQLLIHVDSTGRSWSSSGNGQAYRIHFHSL